MLLYITNPMDLRNTLNERSQTLAYDCIYMRFKDKAELIYGDTRQNSCFLWCVEGNRREVHKGNVWYFEPDGVIIALALVAFEGWAPGWAEGQRRWQGTVTTVIAALCGCHDSSGWAGKGRLGRRTEHSLQDSRVERDDHMPAPNPHGHLLAG